MGGKCGNRKQKQAPDDGTTGTGASPTASAHSRVQEQRLKVCGPTYLQTLRGQLLGHEVTLICCGEAHEDAIDLTREHCVVEAKEGWVTVPCDDGAGFDPEEAMATREGLTQQGAKSWAKGILSGGTHSDSDSDDDCDGGFLVFHKQDSSAGAKARGVAVVFPAEAERSLEHKLPMSAVVWEWSDLDDVARLFNKRRLNGEAVPPAEQDAMIAERKQLRMAEGIELFDDWLIRQSRFEGASVRIVLEAPVPAHEVELHVEHGMSGAPLAPDCFRNMELDSDADSEDEDDPDDGTGSFIEYLRRRLAEHIPEEHVYCIDPRDLGDPPEDAMKGPFQELLSEPLPSDPEEVELEALGVALAESEDLSGSVCKRS